MKTAARMSFYLFCVVLFCNGVPAQTTVIVPQPNVVWVKAKPLHAGSIGYCQCWSSTDATFSFQVLKVLDGACSSAVITISYGCAGTPWFAKDEIVYIRASKYPGQKYYREIYTNRFPAPELAPNFEPVLGFNQDIDVNLSSVYPPFSSRPFITAIFNTAVFRPNYKPVLGIRRS